jgi:phenylacetate-coenzyme A ligase PaaK-like adenylate-forming protein
LSRGFPRRKNSTVSSGKFDRISVGAIIDAHPNFVFHPDDFLISRRYISALTERFERFIGSLRETAVACHSRCEESIASYIARGGLRHIPAYSRLPAASSFRDLPLVTKTDLRAQHDSFIAPPQSGAERWVKMTTGTTGPPIPIIYSSEFYFDVLLLSLPKIVARAGLTRCLSQAVFCLSVNDKKRPNPDLVVADPGGRTGLCLQLHVDERHQSSFWKAMDLLEKLRPAGVASKPPVLEQLCSSIEARGVRADRRPAFIVSSGSMLLPTVRDKLKQCFSTRVIDAYAVTECGLVASECSCGQMHVDWTSVYVETLTESGERTDKGEVGELVVTNLGNAGMPLLRYRTGDFGAIVDDRCACGVDGPRILQLNGKKVTCFYLANRTAFSPTYFNDLLVRFPFLSEFQITQRGLSEFELTVEFNDSVQPATGLQGLEAVRTYIGDSIPGSPIVTSRLAPLQAGRGFQRYRSII